MRIKVVLVVVAIVLFFSPLTVSAGPNDINIIDTPKTYTPFRGDLRFEFCMYDSGGVLGSAILAISDYAFLGVYFDAGQLIGSEEVSWNQPGVLARFLISDGSSMLPPIAIGYSYFMKGQVNKIGNVTVNGIYVVSSQPYFLFGYEQALSFGLRYPVVPLDYSRPENLTLFVGTDLELSPGFGVKGEIENIHLTEGSWPQTFYNFSFDFNLVDLISLSMEFKYSPSIDKVIRILKIGYLTQF